MRLYKKGRKKYSLPPGTIEESDVKGQKACLTLFEYTAVDVQEKTTGDVKQCLPNKDKSSVSWINAVEMDLDLIRTIGTHFGVHPLVAEDIVHLGQRAKVEDYDEYLFIVVNMIYHEDGKDGITSEQISLILGSNYVISFQEKDGDVFGAIRDRIRLGKGRVRSMGADYLAYCLLDAVVDHYFVILEKIGDQLEKLEAAIMAGNRSDLSLEIHQHKRELMFLRKQIWPLREVIGMLQREDSKLVKKVTHVYLRDVYDHTIQVIETIESFRDMMAGLHDMHMTMISNKMNEVMKMLTIIATIFIPITFIAGIYGMNFDYMPELHWRGAYFLLLGLMGAVAGAMILYFKKQKWF